MLGISPGLPPGPKIFGAFASENLGAVVDKVRSKDGLLGFNAVCAAIAAGRATRTAALDNILLADFIGTNWNNCTVASFPRLT
jgi:hypothetical protein